MHTTKNAMKLSLKKLIKKKPLAKITISDIAEDCGISRMTFYYHFKDIYDLVGWCILSDARESAEGNVLTDTWENELITIFKMARLNKEFYLPLFRSMDRELAERYILRYTNRVAVRIVDEYSRELAIDENVKKHLANYYSHSIMGIMLCWSMSDMKENPEQTVKYISILLRSGIPGTIDALCSGNLSAEIQSVENN